MSRCLLPLGCALLLACAGTALPADRNHVDLVPENALIGITIRNVDDLGKKGDALVEKAEWKAPDRPSKLFGMVLDFLGIHAGVDLEGPGGIVMANPKECGVEQPFQGADSQNLLVAIVSFKDRDDMGSNFDLKKGELKADTVTKTKLPGILGGSQEGFLYAHGNRLFIGLSEKAVVSVAKAKPCSNLLTAEQKKAFENADLFAFVGARGWGKEWENVGEQLKQILPDATHGGDEALNQQLLESINSLQHLFMGLRLHDDGASFKLVSLLDGKNASARKLLDSVNAGEGRSDLKGLPEGRVIAAEAFRGEGTRNVALVRALLYSLMTIPGRGQTDLISAADRTTYLGVFAELWKFLKGNRLAVYQNEDDEKKGLFTALAILDTEDPERMLKELRQLMRLGDGKDLKLGKDAAKEDLAQLEKLVRDLGDDDFEVRAAATTRLTLIGQAALPFLEKALESADAEVRHRAELVKEHIVASAEQRRKELLDGTLPKPVRPAFTYVPSAQTLEGKRVDVIQIKLDNADVALAKRLQLVFGPDWDKLRVVVHEKQLVVMFGSEEKLLRAALVNLKDGKPGLAKARSQEAFTRLAGPKRKAELHLSLDAAAALMEARDLKAPKTADEPPLLSLGLGVDKDTVDLDAWLPVAELKVLLNGWK